MPYSLSRYVVRYFSDAYGVQPKVSKSLPRHHSVTWIKCHVALLAMQVKFGTRQKSKHQSALTTRRSPSTANALDDSFYEEASRLAHCAAGVPIDYQGENRPLIQATMVGSRNALNSPDCFVCNGDIRLLTVKEHYLGPALQLRLY